MCAINGRITQYPAKLYLDIANKIYLKIPSSSLNYDTTCNIVNVIRNMNCYGTVAEA